MTHPGTEWCSICDTCVPLAVLLEITNTRTGEISYCHRPGINGGRCWREGVGSRLVHEIRDAAARTAEPAQ